MRMRIEYEDEEERMDKIIDLEGERRPRSKQKWILAEKNPLGISSFTMMMNNEDDLKKKVEEKTFR